MDGDSNNEIEISRIIISSIVVELFLKDFEKVILEIKYFSNFLRKIVWKWLCRIFDESLSLDFGLRDTLYKAEYILKK